jgi:hypothetical protein
LSNVFIGILWKELCIPYITSEDVSAHMPFVSGTLPALLSIAPSMPTLMVSASLSGVHALSYMWG